MERKKRIGYLLVTLVVTLACIPVLPAVAPLPTQPVGAVDTIVAATYNAASTITALVQPTATFTPLATYTPSHTATITPTPTATIIFRYYTPTRFPTATKSSSDGGGGGGGGGGGSGGGGGTSTGDYKCTVLSVTPANNTVITPDVDFMVTWHVKNTGTSGWEHNSVDYFFSSGARIFTQDLYDIPHDVAPGKTVDLSALMHSPIAAGRYTTVWKMRVGNQTFCSMKVTIVIQ